METLRRAVCGRLSRRFFVLRGLYLGLAFLPCVTGNLFAAPSPCIKALTSANVYPDNILTRDEFNDALTDLANNKCSAATIVADDGLFNDLCCTCLDYDVGRFDAWCCMKVTFADSWAGVRIPDELYPAEYAESLCKRIETRIQELNCTKTPSLPPQTSPPSESSIRPTASPVSASPVSASTGDDQIIASEENEIGTMDKLGAGMIYALCGFILILLVGGLCVWMSGRYEDDEESRTTKQHNSREAPYSESVLPGSFYNDDVRIHDPAEAYYSEEDIPRRSKVERLYDTPGNDENQREVSSDVQVEPRFFL